MTIEITILDVYDTTQVKLTKEMPYPIEVYGIVFGMSANVRARIFIADNREITPQLSASADTIDINDNPNQVTIATSSAAGVGDLFEFDPITIEEVLQVAGIASASASIGITLKARPIARDDEISKELARDLSAELKNVTDPEREDQAGDTFFQTRIRGLKQVEVA